MLLSNYSNQEPFINLFACPYFTSSFPLTGEKDVLGLLKRRALMILIGMSQEEEEEEEEAEKKGKEEEKGKTGGGAKRQRVAAEAGAKKRRDEEEQEEEEEEEEEEGIPEDERELLDSDDSDKVSDGCTWPCGGMEGWGDWGG